jgi:NAD-specific glutamate dehydrogenase
VFDEVKSAFEDTVEAVWLGRTENDGFNRWRWSWAWTGGRPP